MPNLTKAQKARIQDDAVKSSREAWRKELDDAGYYDRPLWEEPGPVNTAVALHAYYILSRDGPWGGGHAVYVQFYESGGMTKFVQWNRSLADLMKE